MDKYIGKYRVDIERDIDGNPVENGMTNLRCVKRNKGGMVYRKNSDKLICYIPTSVYKAKNIMEDFHKLNLECDIVEYDNEADIIFNECDLDKVEDIIGLSKSGCNIKPSSIRNHPRYKEIKKENYEKLTDEEKLKLQERGKMLIDIISKKKLNV